MAEKLTTDVFIKKAKEIHGNKYDYSKTVYVDSRTKVCILDENGNEFWQNPTSHLRGFNPSLSIDKKGKKYVPKTIDSFIERAEKIHKGKYDYSKVEYVNSSTKVCIICPEHGEFWMTPNNHLQGQKCPECAKENRAKKTKLGKNIFIEKAKKIHGDKYDYSKVEYNNNREKVCIICNEKNYLTGEKHGEFWMTPDKHLQGQSCPKCSKHYRRTKNEFIKEANIIHLNKYDYSLLEYTDTHSKVKIICPKHGEFWQTPKEHLNGQGCPSCKNSILENEMAVFLKNNNIDYIAHKPLQDGSRQVFDFFLINHNTVIECQGEQHFVGTRHFGETNDPIQNLKTIQERDLKKKKYCENNGIKILYYYDSNGEYYKKGMIIPPLEIYNSENFFNDKEELLKHIY